jgi:hypothetical protein
MILREKDNIIHYQEINDIEVPGSRGQAKADVAGWQALRWQAVPGSDYGRSMVSEYAGDFLSMEEGWKAVLSSPPRRRGSSASPTPTPASTSRSSRPPRPATSSPGSSTKSRRSSSRRAQDFSTLWNVLRASSAGSARRSSSPRTPSATPSASRPKRSGRSRRSSRTPSAGPIRSSRPRPRRPTRAACSTSSQEGQGAQAPQDGHPQVVTGFSALGQTHEAAAIIEWLKSLLEIFGEQVLAQDVKFSKRSLSAPAQGITDVSGLLYHRRSQPTSKPRCATPRRQGCDEDGCG